MIDTSEVLEAYLVGVLRLSGARCVSLFIVPMVGGGGEQRLLHVGDGDPVPELRDEQAALEFASGAAEKMAGNGPDISVKDGQALPSVAEDGVLVPLTLTAPLTRGGGRSPDAPERRASQMGSAPSDSVKTWPRTTSGCQPSFGTESPVSRGGRISRVSWRRRWRGRSRETAASPSHLSILTTSAPSTNASTAGRVIV